MLFRSHLVPRLAAIAIFLLYGLPLFAQGTQNLFADQIQWVNPLPQGQDILRIRPFGTHGLLAVGKSGTIIRSVDDGQTWNYQRFPIYADFYSMHFLDSNKVFVVGAGSSGATYVYYSDDAGQTFSQRFFDINIAMRDIFFVNDSIGFMCGTVGRIAKTTDGGFTWNTQAIGIAQTLTSICFLNADTGYAGSNGTGLRKTTNGGLTWNTAGGYPLTDSYRIGFVNDTIGYVSTYGNRICRTINGGLNWVTVFNPGLSDYTYDFYMVNKDTGIAVSGSYVYRTTNGTTWTGPFLLTGNMRTCAVTKAGTAVISGAYGQLRFDSSIPYSNFTNYDNEATGDLYNRIDFFNSTTGFICTDYGFVYKTTNGGLNWTAYRDTTLFPDNFTDMAVLGSSKIALSSFDGDVMVSSNNGSTFTLSNVNGTSPMYAIDFPNANVGFAVGASGKVVKSINGGNTWVTQTGFPSASTNLPLKDVHFPTTSVGYIGGNGGYIYKTTNGGAAWTSQFVNGLWEIQQIYFLNVDTGWAIDNYGVVAKTTNGSATWTITDTIGLNLQVSDLKFYDANFGVACGLSNLQNATNYSITRDGGLSWTNYVFYLHYGLRGIYIADTSRIFFTGANSSIILSGDSLLLTPAEKSSPGSEREWHIYPNPVRDLIYINGLAPGMHTVMISDLSGKLIASKITSECTSSCPLNIEELPPGTYLLHVRNRHAEMQAKLFVKY